MSSPGLLSLFTIAKLAVATYLFSRRLSRRPHAAIRSALVAAGVLVIVLLGSYLGFSVFPPLTDDLSFIRAIASFLVVLGIMIAAQMLLYESPLSTSVFCCSLAYALENVSSAADRTVVTMLGTGSLDLTAEAVARYWLISAAVFALAYVLLIRRMEEHRLLQVNDPVVLGAAVLVIMVNIVLDLVVKDLGVLDVPHRYQVALTIVYLTICVYIMYSEYEVVYVRRLQVDIATIERVRSMEARHYALSRENIKAINQKCHDIRKQILGLQAEEGTVDADAISTLASEVEVYDSVVKTGNDALDTILTEQSLLCEREGITFSCIVDGSALGFMSLVDLYSFFGNAIENSVAAVRTVDNPERRSISLIVRRRGDMVTIHLENYFEGTLEIADGLPVPKDPADGGLGLGMKSMRGIIEGYGGTLLAAQADGVFHLNAIVPLPENDCEA